MHVSFANMSRRRVAIRPALTLLAPRHLLPATAGTLRDGAER